METVILQARVLLGIFLHLPGRLVWVAGRTKMRRRQLRPFSEIYAVPYPPPVLEIESVGHFFCRQARWSLVVGHQCSLESSITV